MGYSRHTYTTKNSQTHNQNSYISFKSSCYLLQPTVNPSKFLLYKYKGVSVQKFADKYALSPCTAAGAHELDAMTKMAFEES